MKQQKVQLAQKGIYYISKGCLFLAKWVLIKNNM